MCKQVQTTLCSVIDTSSERSGLLHAQTGLHLSGSHHSVSHRHLIYTTDLHVQTGSNYTLSVIDTSSTPRMSECLHAQTGLHLSESHHSVSHRHLIYTKCQNALVSYMHKQVHTYLDHTTLWVIDTLSTPG